MTDPALTVTFLKVLSEYIANRYDEERAKQAAAMKRGDRMSGRDPRDDSKLSQVTLTDPKSKVEVTSLTALTQWLADEYPELTENVTKIIGSETEIKEVLFRHAPELLRQTRQVKPDALRELKAACVTLGHVMGPGGEADVPGMEVITPDPVLQCRPVEDALPRLLSLYREGRIDIDGTVRPLLEEPK